MRRISTRLAFSFLLVALLPTVPLSLVVRDLLERRFGPAIADPLEHALSAGVAESRAHLQERRDRLAVLAMTTADTASLVLLDAQGRPAASDTLAAYLAARPDLGPRARALATPDEAGVSEPERLGDTLAAAVRAHDGTARVVLQPLPAGMVDNARALTDGLGLLRAVRNEQGRVVLSFVGPFLLVWGALIVVALLAGLLWTRQMVRPLEALVGATRRVAGGDLEFRKPRTSFPGW